ncbi:CIC11C00000005887 [Sungouiella intermedia]|uniref:CIC11C00000005887 n=1 Tax=Sungouiella intermedia TaxID=45354 RepID=A0A1L0CWI1_9ASCO|nr:CIC11C00000005887 [[Candida] intermedia]
MEEPVDVSYYLGGASADSLKTLDIVIGSGDIVSIDELPEDPQELISFLQAENCGVKYWVLVAQAYSQAGKLSDAASIVKLGLDSSNFDDSDKNTLHSVLGWIYLKLVAAGIDKELNLANATAEFNHVPDSDSVNSLLARGVLALYKDQTEQALQTFDKLLKRDSSNCLAILAKAQITLSKTQNYSHALKLYQQVLVLNPTIKPDPRIGIGICFWFLKDRSMAINAWERVLELDPENFKARLLLNLASFDSVFTNSLSDDLFVENFKKSLVDLTKLQTENPDDSVVLLALVPYYYSKGNYELVEKIVTKVVLAVTGTLAVVKSNKISPFASKVLAQGSYWLGRVAYAKEDFTQSQKYFHEAIRLNENSTLAKLGLGQSQLGRGSVEEATITFESILKSSPKCLEVNYILGMLYSQQSSKTKKEQAIHMLERYIRLSSNRGLAVANRKEAEALLNKEPVALNAFLTLSKLYESKDLSQSLVYLHKAIESRTQIGQDVPLEVYNNIGVFNFNKSNEALALENFETALKKLDEVSSTELANDLKVTITYNLARSTENSDQPKAIETYESLLKDCPHYFSAKLRLLFLDAVSTNATPKEDIEKEIKELLSQNASDLEIRSFYGWFIKTFGKKIGLKPDADTTHQKETLVEYDSHDCYALISLANIYCVMAKELKGSKEEEKRMKYFVRAIELFTKVLSIDSSNVFAAQGLAIVYIENKDYTKGLDVLRKIRDSLNDISVYLNLGHVLVELKQFSKAIENYEIALVRFTDGNDAKIISFLGRAWYLRGLAEKNLSYLKKALEYSEEALSKSIGNRSSLIFNVAFIQFQIADFITKLPVEHRVVDDINEAIINLNEAIKQLNLLASDDEKHPPYPKSELKSRANLGTSTLLNRLTSCLQETKENISELNNKLEEAKKVREEEEARKLQEREAILAEKKAKEEALAKERAALQEQAQQWAEEARANLVVEESDDDKAFEAENNDKEKKKGKKQAGKKKGSKKKKKDFINDSGDDEEPAPESDEEPEAPKLGSDSEEEPKEKKVNRRKRKAIADDDDEDDQPAEAVPAKENGSKKKKFKSEEIVQESDDDDDDLF